MTIEELKAELERRGFVARTDLDKWGYDIAMVRRRISKPPNGHLGIMVIGSVEWGVNVAITSESDTWLAVASSKNFAELIAPLDKTIAFLEGL